MFPIDEPITPAQSGVFVSGEREKPPAGRDVVARLQAGKGAADALVALGKAAIALRDAPTSIVTRRGLLDAAYDYAAAQDAVNEAGKAWSG